MSQDDKTSTQELTINVYALNRGGAAPHEFQDYNVLIKAGELVEVTVPPTRDDGTKNEWYVIGGKGCGAGGLSDDLADSGERFKSRILWPGSKIAKGCLLIRFGEGKFDYWKDDNEKVVFRVPGNIAFLSNDEAENGPQQRGWADNRGFLQIKIRISR